LTVNVWPPIVSVPCLVCAAVFAAAENVTVPLPLPFVPPVTVSHDGAVVTDVHEHPAGEVTVVDPLPPDATTEALVGESDTEQVIPACVTVNVWPAIVTVPTRCEGDVLAAMLYDTLPPPTPLVEPVSEIHEALLAAVHEQVAPAVTVTLPVVNTDDTERLVGEMPGAQGALNENVFETALAVVPPGPTALTRASKITPGVGSDDSSGRKSTRMTLLAFGVGLPRFTVANAVDDPWG
jgi:hypothetical protein